MSGRDIWGFVDCPKCGNNKLYLCYFDLDCRGNDSSSSGVCQSCRFTLKNEEADLHIQNYKLGITSYNLWRKLIDK